MIFGFYKRSNKFFDQLGKFNYARKFLKILKLVSVSFIGTGNELSFVLCEWTIIAKEICWQAAQAQSAQQLHAGSTGCLPTVLQVHTCSIHSPANFFSDGGERHASTEFKNKLLQHAAFESELSKGHCNTVAMLFKNVEQILCVSKKKA